MSIPFILIFIYQSTNIYGMPIKFQARETAMSRQWWTRQGGIKYIPCPDGRTVKDEDINN